MAKNGAPGSDGSAAGTGKLKLIVLIVASLLLAVGLSVGGTWFILSKDRQNAESVPEQTSALPPVRLPALYQDLQPAFVVNFNYENRTRYLQVSMALMGRDAVGMERLKTHMPLLRNQLVMLLSGQDFAVLRTPEGKDQLLQQALAKVQELAQKETGSPVVEQVLFTNFVLQ